MKSTLSKQITFVIILTFAAYFIYSPGLNGDFLLDDYTNLANLQLLDGGVDAKNLKEYLAASQSGPLKRPISMLSFAANAQDWPADAQGFLFTNIMIHLLNGLLLFFLVFNIFNHNKQYQNKAFGFAIFTTALWLLHPLWVSTTLYVVQRMAMLPLTFMLAGLILYVYSRKKYMLSEGKNGKGLMFLSLFGITFLSVLSKENGILYLLQVALFEAFVIQKFLGWPAMSRALKYLYIVIPVLLVLVLFLIQIPNYIPRYELEKFSMLERVLTQFRVLTQYLYHIVKPDYFTLGVFGDAYQVSRGLLNPVTTLISLIFIVGLLGFAWIFRNRLIWLSFAVFFYFISHLIESTVLPLELYFEHRNYMAAVFLPIPLILLIDKYTEKKSIVVLISLVLCSFAAFNTALRVNIWSDNLTLHLASLEKFPESPRATIVTSNIYAHQDETHKALVLLNRSPMFDKQLQMQLNYILLKCDLSLPVGKDFTALEESFSKVRFYDQDENSFTALLNKTLKDNCGESQKDYSYLLLMMLKNNPAAGNKHIVDLLNYHTATVLIRRNELEDARPVLLHTTKTNSNYASLIKLVDLLIAQKAYKLAGDALEIIQKRFKQDYRFKIDLNLYQKKILYRELLIEQKGVK